MKKLLIAATVMAFAVVANAANYTWGLKDKNTIIPGGTPDEDFLEGGYALLTLGTITQTANGDGTYALGFGEDVLFLTGGAQKSSGSFGNTSVSKPTTDNASLVNEVKSDGTGSQAYTLIILADDTYQTLDAFKAAVADGQNINYFMSYGDSAYGYDADKGVPVPAFYDSTSVIGGSDWRMTGAAVPEPTGGLLLLLGVAGLALRRRRA